MLRYILILTYCIASHVSHSQSIYFNNTYDFNNDFEVAWNIQKLDSGYFLVGGIGDGAGLSRIGIVYIDTLGNEVWKKSFGQGNFNFYPGLSGSFQHTADGGYILGGSKEYPGGDQDAMLWRFNQYGDTLWTKIFEDTINRSIAYHCAEAQDRGYLLAGYSNATTNTIMLIKTDSLGNEEWTQLYNGFSTSRAALSVDTSSDGGYILGAEKNATGIRDIYVIKTDSAGDVEWTKTFGGPYDENPPKVLSTSDNGFLVTTFLVVAEHPSPSIDTTLIYIIKLDSIGNIEWENTYVPGNFATYPMYARELSDGNFIITGRETNLLSEQSGFVFKINNSGDSLWYRGGFTSCDTDLVSLPYFRDIQPTNDGGYIAAGYRIGACGPQDMWVVKMDSCGCWFYGCDTACSGDTTGIEDFGYTADDSKFVVYPNPTTGLITLSGLPKESTRIAVYNILSELVHSEELNGSNDPLIDLSALPGGLYLIQLPYTKSFIRKKIIKQ